MAMASGMLRCFNCTSIAGGEKHKRSSTREAVAKCATLSCQMSTYVDPGVSSSFAAGLHHQLASSSQISRFVYPGVSPLFGLHQLASSSQIHMLSNQRSREVFCQDFGDRSRGDAANILPYRNSNNKRGTYYNCKELCCCRFWQHSPCFQLGSIKGNPILPTM
jgi:hypothetical protein